MLIRHAESARDAAACAAIYAPFVRDTHVSFEEEPPSAEEFSRRIERTTEHYPWLIAEDDGTVAGYAYASAHRERAAYRWAADVAVYIGEGYRRRGVGRELYGELLPLLERRGIQVVCAGVTLPNDASVGLHESVGFQPVGVYRRIGWKGGSWHDVGWWQLELVAPGDGPPAEPGAPVEPGPPAEPGAPTKLDER
jgi:L-amino acid N-acyltransferase YncA